MITEQGLAYYHAWAFATTRQLGAAFELAAQYLRWLEDEALAPAAESFDEISPVAKTFILKAARAVNARRPLDGGPMFDADGGGVAARDGSAVGPRRKLSRMIAVPPLENQFVRLELLRLEHAEPLHAAAREDPGRRRPNGVFSRRSRARLMACLEFL